MKTRLIGFFISSFIGTLANPLAYAADVKADTPVTPVTPPVVICEMTATSTIANPADYGLTAADGGTAMGMSVTYPDIVLLQAYCYSDRATVAKTVTDKISFPACASSTGQVCLYKEILKPDNLALNTTKVLVAEYLIQNKSTALYTIKPTDLVTKVGPGSTATELNGFVPVNVSPPETPIYPPTTDAKCRVVVSGALDPIPEDVAVPEVRVSNGKLLFTATVSGLTGLGGGVVSTTWTGGPDANGIWEAPPLNVLSTVTAAVKIQSGATLNCSIKIKPSGSKYTAGLSRFGDCGFFGAARSYYFLDSTNKGFQNSGYNPALQLLGLPVKYGQDGADIPFKGVVNGAASLDGVISSGTNGQVSNPPAEFRKYSAAVIVARSFNAATQKVGSAPIAWGRLDYSNYSTTQLDELENVGDDETVVFQVFLAASQLKDGVDIRGGADATSIPFHDFRSGTNDNKPYDRIVPMVNASCGAMVMPAPARGDKALPSELSGLKMCAFSKPHLMSDLRNGRVNLDVMHVVPETALHRFPTDLLKSASSSTCTSNQTESAANSVPCWNISASAVGINTAESPFTSHSSCQQTSTKTITSTVSSGYGSSTVTTTVPTVTYKASCQVLEQNECGPSMAIRFSGYRQMMVAALGCAAKYESTNKGEQVTATLMNQGILPYTSFGGSAPKHYANYANQAKFNGQADTKGYACIPCRFSGDASKAGTTLDATTKQLPVDQDVSSTPRKPIYSFTKGTAPKDCVKDVSFEVRYFGSAACDGVSDPANQFCKSGNISQQSCPTTDGGTDALKTSGGGNVAGSFRIPVCPGSGIEYDSVSVSWSPIIVDVTGNGISVSRSFEQSRVFDIRGDGRQRVIDWPYNTNEVAFLVRPNKGKVTSIKELFGDYKAANGFEAMRKLDSNKDGVITSKDKAFSELALWFDRNRNGKLDAGELETLAAHGVRELPLQYVKPNRKGAEGRTLSTVYFNHKQQRYMNIEDHYFYEYITNGRKMSQK